MLVALLGTATERLAHASAASSIHVVEPGDTLWSLARARGCSLEQLQAANPERSSLRPGDTVKFPRCDAPRQETGTHYTVVRGDTLGGLAQRYGVTLEDLRERNDLPGTTIRIGQRLIIPAGTPPPPTWVLGQSFGRPQRGQLRQGEQLPGDAAYYRRRPGRAWGATHVVRQVRAAVHEVHKRHPRVHRLAIGDLSAPRGGPISEHSSHQSGRDVDLGLYYAERPAGYPQSFVSKHTAKLDLAATWSLIEALYEQSKHPGGPEKIFLDYEIQKELYLYARTLGMRKSELSKIFQYPHGAWAHGCLVQHVRKHDDHIHVRFSCPPEDASCH